MIGNCQDATDKAIMPFDDLILEMFKYKDDLSKLKAIQSFVEDNRYDYCLVHLMTLRTCVLGYIMYKQ